jgi:threonine/homoserine/homoserine lactone efflux protein
VVGVLKIALGALLLLVGVRRWRGRPRDPDQVAVPKWMGALDTFTPFKATGTGALLSGLNPKNTLLAVAGAAAIAGTGIAPGQQIVAYGIFVVIATVGLGAPVVLSFAMGDRSRALLDDLQAWLAVHNAVIMAVVLLLLGTKLIGDGVSGL